MNENMHLNLNVYILTSTVLIYSGQETVPTARYTRDYAVL